MQLHNEQQKREMEKKKELIKHMDKGTTVQIVLQGI